MDIKYDKNKIYSLFFLIVIFFIYFKYFYTDNLNLILGFILINVLYYITKKIQNKKELFYKEIIVNSTNEALKLYAIFSVVDKIIEIKNEKFYKKQYLKLFIYPLFLSLYVNTQILV